MRSTRDVLEAHGEYEYDELLVEGDYGMLRWHGHSEDVHVHDGVDSFTVREGLILAQTIYYVANEDRR